ncbi:hypothetical protein BDN70DRAFT_902257 [Pholiota conissans]|uniref:Uncharacterized protein n=1 Tax=Pholiota conissans TaxID=109636 RepID=A0A9P5YJ47_9AGAR|nr:hypothetical protein BDN70DRAFT_902257 [Pholiota conissans]
MSEAAVTRLAMGRLRWQHWWMNGKTLHGATSSYVAPCKVSPCGGDQLRWRGRDRWESGGAHRQRAPQPAALFFRRAVAEGGHGQSREAGDAARRKELHNVGILCSTERAATHSELFARCHFLMTWHRAKSSLCSGDQAEWRDNGRNDGGMRGLRVAMSKYGAMGKDGHDSRGVEYRGVREVARAYKFVGGKAGVGAGSAGVDAAGGRRWLKFKLNDQQSR